MYTVQRTQSALSSATSQLSTCSRVEKEFDIGPRIHNFSSHPLEDFTALTGPGGDLDRFLPARRIDGLYRHDESARLASVWRRLAELVSGHWSRSVSTTPSAAGLVSLRHSIRRWSGGLCTPSGTHCRPRNIRLNGTAWWRPAALKH